MFKNFSWGHGIVLALGAFIIFILSMIFLFPIGKQNSDMVTENYYEEELLYQEVINAKNRANELAEKPIYNQTKNEISVIFPSSIGNVVKEVEVDLSRTDDENLDIKKKFNLDQNFAFKIPSNVLKNGNYTLRLSWEKDKQLYRIDYDVVWK